MPKAAQHHTPKRAIPSATAVNRLKEIAAQASDNLLPSDGPPHPDHKLLELCGEALGVAWKEYQALAYSTDRAVAFLRRKNAAGVASEIIIQPIAIELNPTRHDHGRCRPAWHRVNFPAVRPC